MKHNVVVTGRGLVTPIGIGLAANEDALRKGKSGISFMKDWQERGAESTVAGVVDESSLICPILDKKTLRYMTPHTIMGAVATYEAFAEAGFEFGSQKNYRMAIVLGHGGSAHIPVYEGARVFEDTKKIKRITPFTVPKAMPSSAVASISLIFGIKGESYAVSSACASGSHSMMVAARLLQSGAYDVVLTGGTEEVNWVHAAGFDAMHALSRNYNATPEKSSRPFDKNRDGFVISSGAGILVMETEEHAKKRNARIISRVSGFSANSNTTDMVFPDGNSTAEVMRDAVASAGIRTKDISYINTHGTATPVGDPIEIGAIKQVFFDSNKEVPINSTKSMTGHMIGATASVEAIFCTQMIDKSFVCPTINLDNPEDDFSWANLPRETINNMKVTHCVNNSLGFGGTNACLVLSAP